MTAGGYDMMVVLGPTACGKTSLAARLAHHLGGEVISADSRQVYRGMDLGTGKDYADYLVDGNEVPVHMIDMVNAGYRYNVYEYQRDFYRVMEDLRRRKRVPVVCGGTGMYLEAVLREFRLIRVPVDTAYRRQLEEYSMEKLARMLRSYKTLHNVTDTVNRKRLVRALEIGKFYADHPEKLTESPPMHPLVTGITIDRETRRQRISERLHRRLDEGMVEEVKHLMDGGVDLDTLVYYGLEYKFIAYYLTGDLSYTEMCSQLETAIHQFAKRQMTWFRGMERRGISIRWIDFHLPLEEKIRWILAWYQEGEIT
jgi:tRNA dimethylallyltransferase